MSFSKLLSSDNLICMVLFLQHMMNKNFWLKKLGITFIPDSILVVLSSITGAILLLRGGGALLGSNESKNISSSNKVDSIVYLFILYIFIVGFSQENIVFQSYYSLLQFALIYLFIQLLGTMNLINKIVYTMIILFIVDLFTMLYELFNTQLYYNSFQSVGMSFYAFPFLFGFALYYSQKRYYLLSICSSLIIIVSGLRRGWIFLMVSVLIFIHYQNINKKIKIWLMIVIIGLGASYSIPNLQNRTSDQLARTLGLFSGDVESGSTNRDVLWDVGMSITKENILFGNGYTNTNFNLKKELDKHDYGIRAGRVHNLYIEILGDLGVVGSLIFAVLLIRVILGLHRGIIFGSRISNLRRIHLQIFLALFVGLLFVGIFGWGGIYNKEFWIYLALISLLIKITKYENTHAFAKE